MAKVTAANYRVGQGRNQKNFGYADKTNTTTTTTTATTTKGSSNNGNTSTNKSAYASDTHVQGTPVQNAQRNENMILDAVKNSAYIAEDSSDRDAYLNQLQSSLAQQQALNNQLNSYYEKQYADQQKQLAATRENAKRNAYISNQVGMKNLEMENAQNGVNGGLSESSKIRMLSSMNRNKALADINYNSDLSSAYQNMVDKKATNNANMQSYYDSYNNALSNAPSVKTYTAYDAGKVKKLINNLATQGYTEEEIEEYLKNL